MVIPTLIASAALLIGWIVLQIRISVDRDNARAHELAVARQAADDRLTEQAGKVHELELKRAETRLADAKAFADGYRSNPQTQEIYLRHYLGGSAVYDRPEPKELTE